MSNNEEAPSVREGSFTKLLNWVIGGVVFWTVMAVILLPLYWWVDKLLGLIFAFGGGCLIMHLVYSGSSDNPRDSSSG